MDQNSFTDLGTVRHKRESCQYVNSLTRISCWPMAAGTGLWSEGKNFNLNYQQTKSSRKNILLREAFLPIFYLIPVVCIVLECNWLIYKQKNTISLSLRIRRNKIGLYCFYSAQRLSYFQQLHNTLSDPLSFRKQEADENYSVLSKIIQ